MTTPDRIAAQQAIDKALQALKDRQRTQARYWASQAARLNPALEDPWLILAAIASPEASVVYLQRALEINPTSQRARKGMAWAFDRQRAQQAATLPHPQAEPTRPVKVTPAENIADTQKTRVVRRKQVARPQPAARAPFWTGLGLSLVAILVIGCLAFIFWLGFSARREVSARGDAAPRPVSALQKPTLSPTATRTATATFTPTASPTRTATRTPKPTKTPRPTLTATEIPTDAPVVEQPAPEKPVEIVVDPKGNERWIDVNLSNQTLAAFEGSELINSFAVSTGTWEHPTVTGQYHIYVKYTSASMSGPGYYLPNVPYVMYFYEGYGLHGTYWHNNFGTPMSHGCVNLRTDQAGWLFDFASVGTLVNIHY